MTHASHPINARARNSPVTRKAAIFRNGRNQAVRLPQDFRFPEGTHEVLIHKDGDSLVLAPSKADWRSFFASRVRVPDNFLSVRGNELPQSREPL